MRTKQTVIIIGATGIRGSFIAENLAKGNYRLLLNDRNTAELNELKNAIIKDNPAADIEVIDCSFDGCWEADIIISTVAFATEKEITGKIKEVANQKIFISFSNPANEECGELQRRLPNSKVIRVDDAPLDAEVTTGVKQLNISISGNDREALLFAAELLTTAGFNINTQNDYNKKNKI